MKNLILLTSSFPYEGGEQFLETEIEYWQHTGFDNVYIMPNSNNGVLRDFPQAVKIIKKEIRNVKSKYIFLAIFNFIFYKEIVYIIREREPYLYLESFKEALRSTAILLRERGSLRDALLPYKKDENTIYCYWNDMSFYAACTLKNTESVKYVISRAHGGDLYEERKSKKYMPLKRQFMNAYDKVYLLSEGAVEYYHKTYKAKLTKLDIAPLGVEMPKNIPNSDSDKYKINILSISYCVPVKQIHKILEALSEYASMNKDFLIEWTHIGNGPLYQELQKNAQRVSFSKKNLEIKFVGHLKNIEVKSKLEINYFDIFINTSESEGIPVSIMEAMSYKIPAIAPNVGGVADLVNENNGYLMPSNFSTTDIITGIDTIYKNPYNKNYRDNAYSWIFEKFNSELNYPKFIKKIERIASVNESK